MEAFPISWPLAGRTVALIGRGAFVERKRTLLAKTPARLIEFSETPAPEQLFEAAFVIVAYEDRAEAEAGAAAARAAGKPVNVVDQPDLSDFHVPAIVDRGGISIGVGSGGVAPTLARDVRAAIEAAVPPSTAQVYELARRIRQDMRRARPDYAARRALWERVLRGAPGEAARRGDLEGAEALARRMITADIAPTGAVWLVGAGPGDPELLTLKALRCLQDADLVVYDRLVDPRILDLARRDAEFRFVGKARADHALPQEDIQALLVEAALAGKRVVRLKGGDPFVFGRGGEELEALRAAGVEAHVVPGITAALGCAAAVGAPLTHRDHADAVTLLTATGKAGPLPLENRALADPRQTLVIYMGAHVAAEVAQRLLAAGRAPETPALIVENGTRETERVIPATLAGLAQAAARARLQGPALLIIGAVAGLAEAARTSPDQRGPAVAVQPLLERAVS